MRIPSAGRAGLVARRPVWPAILVLATCVLIYANALPNGFVIDDVHQIVENPLLRDIRSVPRILTSGVWDFEGRSSSYYRPLMHLVYLAVYQVFGLAPWAYRLVNVLLHAGTSVLVLRLVARLLPSLDVAGPWLLWPPVVGALLFATHPVHTEAVAWIAGITDVAFAFFYVLALSAYTRAHHARPRDHVLPALAFFLAMLCKETAVTLPAVLLGYDVLVRREGAGPPRSWARYAPYGAALAAYLALRVHALRGLAPTGTPLALTPGETAVNVLVLLVRYLATLLWPVSLNFYHVFRPRTSVVSVEVMVALLAVAALLGLGWRARRRHATAAFALLLIVVPLAPVLYLPGLNQGIENAFAERYLHLPVAGLALLAAVLLVWLRDRGARPRGAAALVLLLVAVAYGVGTVRRNPVWRDDLALWTDVAAKSPDAGIAHQNLGFALLHAGRAAEGQAHLARAVALRPDLPELAVRKGLAYAARGLTKQAILEFHAALVLRPDFAEAHYNLAVAYEALDWGDAALAHYEAAVELRPDHAAARNNLGVAYARRGRLAEAIAQFEAAVRLEPADPEFRANLGRARGS